MPMWRGGDSGINTNAFTNRYVKLTLSATSKPLKKYSGASIFVTSAQALANTAISPGNLATASQSAQ